jgi:acyl CoA:acetate/3-ketoacid CoA transferase beta subunit
VTTTGARTHVITDLGVGEPHEGELMLTNLHPGVTVEDVKEATGLDRKLASRVVQTEPPADDELAALRELVAR